VRLVALCGLGARPTQVGSRLSLPRRGRAPYCSGVLIARYGGLRSCPHDKCQSTPGGVSDSLVGLAGWNTPGFIAYLSLPENRLPCHQEAIHRRVTLNPAFSAGLRAGTTSKRGRRGPEHPIRVTRPRMRS
jgi:hypothetical protein